MVDKKKEETTAVQAAPPAGALERPSFIEQSTAGTADIGINDVKLPMLKIAQGLSKQIIPSESVYIKDLKLFDLFDDLQGTIYGVGPLTFVVVRRDVKRIEFDPENRNIPIDLKVPANDPRMDWGKDPVTGKGIPPRAVKFVEFVILLVLPDGSTKPIVMSIQETNKFQKKAHERLSGFIKMRQPPAPIYAGLYTVEVKSEKTDKGTFGVFVVNNSGYIQDAALYATAKKEFESFKDKVIDVERAIDPDAWEEGGGDKSGDTSGM